MSKKSKILAVDDDPINNEILKNILGDIYDIESVTSGQECLEKIHFFDPQLVILDIMMPVMDGFELCQKLQDDEKTKKIPVIFVTARTMGEDLEKGLSLGAIDYIKKPYEPIEIFARARTAIFVKQTQDKLEDALIRQKQVNQRLEEEISERKRVESALRESEHQLTKAKQLAGLGNYRLDLGNNNFYCSEEVFHLFKTEIKESPVKSGIHFCFDFIHPDDKSIVREKINEAIQNKRYFQVDHRIIRKDGVERIVHQEGEIVSDPQGKTINLIGIIQDISEAKHATALKRAYLRQNIIVEEERARLAKDLHDDVLQVFGLMERNMHKTHNDKKICYSLNKPPQNCWYENEHEKVFKLIDTGKEKIRQVINNLQPMILKDLGLVAALRSFTHDLSQKTGINIEFRQISNVPPRPLDIELAIFRIAQEALNNMVKHAQTNYGQILLGERGNTLWLQVEDEGNGFDLKKQAIHSKLETYGLFYMRERAEQIAGKLMIQSQLGEGTTIILEVPQGVDL